MAPFRCYYDFARIHSDARPVDAGDGYRVRGAGPVPNVRHLVTATGPVTGKAGFGGRRPGVDGLVQGGHRRRRPRVQGPVNGHHQADRAIRGVQRQLCPQRIRLGRRLIQHHICHHAHVQATRTDRRPDPAGADAHASQGHSLAGR